MKERTEQRIKILMEAIENFRVHTEKESFVKDLCALSQQILQEESYLLGLIKYDARYAVDEENENREGRFSHAL